MRQLPTDYDSASAACESRGAHLAVPGTAVENAFLASARMNPRRQPYTWLGFGVYSSPPGVVVVFVGGMLCGSSCHLDRRAFHAPGSVIMPATSTSPSPRPLVLSVTLLRRSVNAPSACP